jgi:hypothetical protein
MNFHVDFCREKNILRVSWENQVKDQDIRDYYNAVTSAMKSVGQCSGICDFSAVTKLQVSSNMVEELAARPALIPEGYTHVIVAPQEHVYGLVRMYETLTNRNNVVVVRTIEDAYKILKLASPEFTALEQRK